MALKITKTMQDIAAEEARLAAKKQAARMDAIETANSIIAVFGLKASELDFNGKTSVKATAKLGREKVRATRKSVAPKYRGPNGELWTGRGKKPRWVEAALSAGSTLEDLAIDKAPAAAPAAETPAA